MTPPTTGKPPQTTNRISIENYLRELEKKRRQTLDERETLKAPIPLTYEQFCRLIAAHGSNYFAERGETTLFRIDNNNTGVIRQLYLYLTNDPAFGGQLTKGILINGKFGSGKTAIMYALSRTFNDCVRHAREQGITLSPMRIVKSSDIVDAFRYEANKTNPPDTSFQGDKLRIDTVQKNYLNGILIIDELGREQKEINVWGTVLQPLSQVLQERYDNAFPTFATANFRLETLSGDEYYGKMVGDRLRQMFNVIHLDGDSRRR